MNDGPLFSIITVCLNADAHLAGALDSVLAQTSGEYEYVIEDGASADATLDIVRDYEPRFAGRLRWTSEPDDGLYDAMNRALGRATGRYVQFLGADDRLRPGALAAVERTLQANPDADMIFGATHVVSPDGVWDQRPQRVVRRGLPARPPASHQSMFVRREALLAAGGFDPRYRIAADYDAYLRLVEQGASEVLIDDVLAEFALGGTSSRDARATARDYRDVRIAHGASAVVEEAVMLKSTAAALGFAAWMRLFGRAPGASRGQGAAS